MTEVEESASCTPLHLISSDATEAVSAARTQKHRIIGVAIDQHPLQQQDYKSADTKHWKCASDGMQHMSWYLKSQNHLPLLLLSCTITHFVAAVFYYY